MTATRNIAEKVVELGVLALRFARVERVTYHEDGQRPETDADHTVMLGLIAPAFAQRFLPQLDLGLVAQFALVHDLVEAYSGDVNTLLATPEEYAAKKVRESQAAKRIVREFRELPWVGEMLLRYEAQDTPEARYVKAMDKQMPKITHILNKGRTLVLSGTDRHQVHARYAAQTAELYSTVQDMPELLALRILLLDMMYEAVPWEEIA